MDRFDIYNKISEKLVVLSDDVIKKLTNPDAESGKIKWGVYGTINIDGINVFYKKIPLSDMFASNQFNTLSLEVYSDNVLLSKDLDFSIVGNDAIYIIKRSSIKNNNLVLKYILG